MQPSYPGDEKMQAGIGGEERVISDYQFSVFSESRRKSVWGAPLASFEMQSGVAAELLTAASVGTNPESNSGPPVNVYLGVPTKFHLPQAKDSCTGRK